ncbi:cation-translocating P-type ATPase [Lactonifactor longoviformis]|uniref:cation-translocating P-type ATPase n=1 Tax=Lactonifactor TaxID=420345 RepID=UPI0012B084EB|nr:MULTISPECIES: cation-translocating P-type ATPase [Lactonifactor]MCQ4669820.1 cation-translocating P-type ATPase [Lactonifactor longoviformis]MSA00274.1 HAD-IC family P-type ATPase [Lactonifactor sp. BIOML-A5]MSA09513.1 HAD-IC family P-type ATPase [Lactonifactor sp. BIOML-A4]MSA12263.1 HAD-IC family P-type ATPase [Lactonifactor sp. BIOML-A3]MSA18561.1 HAD-IC family P-type ATPase [Lactonifactor sp. BIOML-A2]
MFEIQDVNELEERFRTDSRRGLPKEEARSRLKEYGENVLKKEKGQTVWGMILEQLNEPMIFILFMAAAISMLLREYSDTIIIFVVIAMNTAVGVIQEGKARKAMEALKKLAAPVALVKRDNEYQEIPASQVVPGDLVKIEAGRQVPADVRITSVRGLAINESALTGESMPVEKTDQPMSAEAPMADRKNMAYMTTEAMKGQGEGIVVATGMETELGKIAGLINETTGELTPLQKRLGDLGKILSVVAVALCVGLFLIGVVQHRNILQMLLLAISLAVAAIPEGLPAVVTIVLALGVARMVKVNTIIRKLPAVETLGAVGVVCSDKTGTLTENKMKVVTVYCNGEIMPAEKLNPQLHDRFLEGYLLCNDSQLGEQEIGDPTELALLYMGKERGVKKEVLEKQKPRIGEQPFDSQKKYMVTVHREGKYNTAYVKGAGDYILEQCTGILVRGKILPMTQVQRMKIRQAMESMARDALRVLALAMKERAGEVTDEGLMKGLVFIGLTGMMDPPREAVRNSVSILHRAGVKVAMITGDHKDTAYAIANKIGIADAREQCISGDELERMTDERLEEVIPKLRVFARVTPEHKVRIVRGFKKNGQIVAMTGDGVNDAPSLQAADIGIAMGKSGTDVAKNAADMILTDDNFSTIEKAMEEGRSIYVNIKKSILFLLSSNFGEIITMFAAVLLALPTPLKASHILWVNLITDSLPALALGVDKNNRKTLMNHPPRDPGESLFAHGGWFLTVFYGMVIAGITLYAFHKGGQTYAFTVLGVSQLFHAIGMRDTERSIFRMNHLENPFMIFAFFAGLGLQFMVTEIPYFVQAFQTVKLDMGTWLWLLAVSAIPLLFHELRLLFIKKEK